MAEDDEAHRKVAVKVSGALGAGLLALAVPFTGWGVAGRGSWQATAAFGFAAGLVIAALGQGLLWYLMHVRRSTHAALPSATNSDATPQEPARSRADIEHEIAALQVYRAHAQRCLDLHTHEVRLELLGAPPDDLLRQLQESREFCVRRSAPISAIVRAAGVTSRLTAVTPGDLPTIMLQSIGVLEDERDKMDRKRHS